MYVIFAYLFAETGLNNYTSTYSIYTLTINIRHITLHMQSGVRRILRNTQSNIILQIVCAYLLAFLCTFLCSDQFALKHSYSKTYDVYI